MSHIVMKLRNKLMEKSRKIWSVYDQTVIIDRQVQNWFIKFRYDETIFKD